jgi:hypothetical protein
MRKWVALFAGIAWLVLAQPGAAMASGSGPETWTVVSRNGQPTRVAASGVVTSAGTVTDFLVLHLDTGTFDNHAVQAFPEGNLLYHGQGTAQLVVDPRTCIGTGRFVGPFVIEGGTGAFAGASGSGTAIGDLTFVYSRTATGCAQVPIQSWGVAHATGQLTVP